MASRAAETSEKMEAKHKVTALQKAMVMIETQLFFYMFLGPQFTLQAQ